VWEKLSGDDTVLGMSPLFHITGLVASIGVAALTGIPLVLYYRFDPVQTFRMIEKWRPTTTVAAITVFIALMNHPDAKLYDLSCLTRCYSGGAPMAPTITEAFEKQFGVYVHSVYGLTESSSPTHMGPVGQRLPVNSRIGAPSVGLPVPGCDVRVFDLDNPSQEVCPLEAGELGVRGPMLFKGYWNRPDETENAFLDGYFLTGDVVIMDENGFFYVVDRKKDMIIASGYKVWPREVEDTLYLHPGVKEAAVIGVADEYRGETVKAFVSLKDSFRDCVTQQELIDFCRERIAAYKYPRAIEFVQEVPRTVTGKFLRRLLRDQQT